MKQPRLFLLLLLVLALPRSAMASLFDSIFIILRLRNFLCWLPFGCFCDDNSPVTEAPTTINPTTTQVPLTAVTPPQRHVGLCVIADFADAQLENYPEPASTQIITNEQQLREEILLPMQKHWEYMSLGCALFEWRVLRITLDETLAADAFTGWNKYRDAVANKIVEAFVSRIAEDSFDNYDQNQDGIIDSCFVIASSHGQDYDYFTGGASRNGQVNMFVDVQHSQSLQGRHIGNFNHEVGHCFGLPDIYGAYDTIKYLTLMSDSWRLPPNSFSAYERYRLDWLVPARVESSTSLTTTHHTVVLQSAEQAMDAILVPTHRDTEYFLIEYRRRPEAGFGSGVPSAYNGVAIYHVWEDAPRGNKELPALIRLESARGTYRWNSAPEVEDFWTPDNSPEDGFVGVPYYDMGEYTLVQITNFRWVDDDQTGIQMDFSVNLDGFTPTNYTSDPIQNGDFEDGEMASGPAVWMAAAWIFANTKFSWDASSGVDGSACAKIETLSASNDAAFVQTVTGLQIGERYRVRGMLKVTSIIMGNSNTGATISRHGTWEHSDPINQVSDEWTAAELIFVADADTAEISCRLGYWSSDVKGTLLCDNFSIEWIF